ncbi:MAG: protein-glutamate O-methyltransferase CheR [Rubrivivax sp.]
MTATETSFTLSDADFRRVSELVYKHCGINLHEGKRELVQGRLAKQLRIHKFSRVSEYLDHVTKDPSKAEFDEFIDSLSTNLTSFFREVAHFHHLTDAFLPALIAKRKRDKKASLRAGAPGCSTGEEPYSLTMTLVDTLEKHDAADWDVRLLATDICTRVLKQAEAGVYPKAKLQGIPPEFRNRFLQPVNARAGRNAAPGSDQLMTMSQELRQRIRFRYLNLMTPWPFSGPFDFIFCRNVMIYFDKPTQEKLVNRYWDLLEPGGLLFTGHSESLTGINHKFKYVKPTIYQK